MKRFDIIRRLIENRGYKSYLEIGVLGNETFNSLPSLDVKHSVDPNGQAVFNVTSDDFFANHCKQSYDIIFIDGLHLAEQVEKDIENSLTHLNEGGIIVVHDCLPSAEYEQLREGVSGKPWTGDVWKAFAKFVLFRSDLYCRVVNTDYGCGLIERGQRILHGSGIRVPVEYTWEYYVENRDAMMNVITVEEFLGRR